MSTSYGGTPPGITGTHYGGSSLGVLGSLVPSGGLDGAGYLYAGLSLPADAAKEVRGPITRWPAGTLTVYEDSSFTYDGATDYALYALYVDGVASTDDIGYGAGIGRFDLNIGGGFSGGVDLASAVTEGVLASFASQMGGGVDLDHAVSEGSLASSISQVGGNIVLADGTVEGGFVGIHGLLTGDVLLDESATEGAIGSFPSELSGGVFCDDAVTGGAGFLGSLPASAAEIWSYVLSNGKTAEQTVVEAHAMLTALTAALSGSVLMVDVRKMNGVDVIGAGADGDPWRGVGVSP